MTDLATDRASWRHEASPETWIAVEVHGLVCTRRHVAERGQHAWQGEADGHVIDVSYLPVASRRYRWVVRVYRGTRVDMARGCGESLDDAARDAALCLRRAS